MGAHHATVVHKKKQYARIVKIPIASVCKRVRDRVAKLPSSSSRTYRMKAGDNVAEGMFSVVKRSLRRMNLLSSTRRVTVNFLSAAWLHKHRGIVGVARGLSIYQNSILDSCPPIDAYKSDKFLTQMEPMS